MRLESLTDESPTGNHLTRSRDLRRGGPYEGEPVFLTHDTRDDVPMKDRDDWLNCPACTHGRSEHHIPNPPRLMRYDTGGDKSLGLSPKIRHSTTFCMNCEKCLVEYALPYVGRGADEAGWLADLAAQSVSDTESLSGRFLAASTLLEVLYWRVNPDDDDERGN
jgi:hypothetical protein